MDREIVVRGAREHNLQDVDLQLPHGKLICFTGVSGSGKSSLAFDTIYAEGQRRYLESLSSYARQFIGQLPKPDVDHLSGLSPSISISQKSTSHNPRSTVGTITEIQDFLRVLFARVGTSFCPKCGQRVAAQTVDQIYASLTQKFAGQEVLLLAPLIRMQKGEHRDLFELWLRQGFVRARVDGQLIDLANPPRLEKLKKHSIELVVNRCNVPSSNLRASDTTEKSAPKRRGKSKADADQTAESVVNQNRSDRDQILESLRTAVRIGEGSVIVVSTETTTSNSGEKKSSDEDTESNYSTQFACGACQLSFEPPSPQLLSFNSPQGMCPDCSGLGVLYSYEIDLLIPDPTLSIRGGAVVAWGPWSSITKANQTRLRTITEAVESRWKISKGYLLRTPWQKLTPEQKDFLLNGGDFVVAFKERVRRNKNRAAYAKFNGILSELKVARESTRNPLLRRQHEKLMRATVCPTCAGERLNAQARNLRLHTLSKSAVFKASCWLGLAEFGNLPLADALEFIEHLELDDIGWLIASEAVKEVKARLGFLLQVGLEYLTLNRTAPTLSGGESQRIRLASQIGSGLVGVTYVLDEPSIGLHPRDNDRLIGSLKRLRDLGNTLLVVEHDEDTMQQSDILVDFGPGPGVRGGELIGVSSFEELAANDRSLTGDYISGRKVVGRPAARRPGNGKKIEIKGARHHNLKNVDVEIPLGCFVCVTGVSGSGKSSLISDILSPSLANLLMKAQQVPGLHDSISGAEQLDKIIDIDQSPIGRTPRSNPATYVKVFDEIRNLYAQLTESKRRGYNAGRFSFNTDGGRCSACEGNGATRLDMEMLADLWVPCPVCDGKRYDRETLEVEFKGKSIADALNMDVQEALTHFENVPKIAEKLQTLHDVGLDYIKLGQPSPTLSGGEAQRIKLAKELSRRSTGRTMYVLDEPTTGLHFHDISMLLSVLQKLVELGNTIVVVEHNLDLIQAADWVIDLGQDGGHKGGEVIASGTPEEVSQVKLSYTGEALKKYFASQLARTKKKRSTKAPARTPKSSQPTPLHQIIVHGAQSHNLRTVDVAIERDQMTVFCGRSGSGKTSLAMDTIYAEGQRRYVESLSSYARQFVGQMPKPIVESITGLSPAVALEQKNLGHTPRSTVGTVTEIYDYLRVFMARAAQMRCPTCKAPVVTQTVDQIVDRILQHPENTRALILAPIVDRKSYSEIQLTDSYFEKLLVDGFTRVRIDGVTTPTEKRPALDPKKRQDVQVVVDRIEINGKSRSRISDSVEQALRLSDGRVQLALSDDKQDEAKWPVETHSLYLSCLSCGKSYAELTPHHFSFNTPVGWCSHCEGLGKQIGTNLESLIDPTRSLQENGLMLWPSTSIDMSKVMLNAIGEDLSFDLKKPVGALTSTQRNLLLFGTGDRWYVAKKSAENPYEFSFQYRGVMPALEMAAKSSPSLRMRLDMYVAEVECLMCTGSRVRAEAANAIFRDNSIVDLVNMSLGNLLTLIQSWKLTKSEQKIAGELLREIEKRLTFLLEVGLEYLTLGRAANSLSGGEAQRIRLASQLGSGLGGVLYVLDEPTIGLHPRDNHRLISALHRLRDNGNTLLVVEHDREVIAKSDCLCDFGPGSGHLGGQIVAQGTVNDVRKKSAGVTGPYLSGKKAIAIPSNRRPIDDHADVQWLVIRDAHMHTLRHLDVAIPLGRLTAVTGPSGSGKSSLINGILYPALARKLHRANLHAGPHRAIDGVRYIDKVVRVDQSPLGNSPSSTPATYSGVFEEIRSLFAKQPEAKTARATARDFSFNVPGGRCEKCEGNGQCKIEMHFLPDVWVECDSCRGQRYTSRILNIRYRGKSINDVLTMSIAEAIELFEDHPKIVRTLKILDDVGLGYVSLGQSAPTLSGGEAQRVKLAAELARPATGQTLYLFDEPTTGLHFDDIAKLLHVFNRLVDQGNTVVVIEHNLDVVKCADWVIDLGQEAGWEGGQLVFAGTPEGLVEHAKTVAKLPTGKTTKPATRRGKPKGSFSTVAATNHSVGLISYTGIVLQRVLAAGPYEELNRMEVPFSPVANLDGVDKKELLRLSQLVTKGRANDFDLQLFAELMSQVLNEVDSANADDFIGASLGSNIVEYDDESSSDMLDAYSLSNCLLEVVTNLEIFEPEVVSETELKIIDTDGKSWFARIKRNDDLVAFSFRVPQDTLENLALPRISSRFSSQRVAETKSSKFRKAVNSYYVTQSENWAIVEFTMNTDSVVDIREFTEWLTEAAYETHDAIHDVQFTSEI